MMELVINTLKFIAGSALDVLPIAIFLFAFQLLVIRRPMPNRNNILIGFGFVVIGLGLFLVGLDQTLFPLGRLMAQQLTSPDFVQDITDFDNSAIAWHDYHWIYLFGFMMGFATALAEPALIAVAMKANIVSGGAIGVTGLRVAVAFGVGIGVSLGCLRIITGVPLHYFVAAAYLIVIIQTLTAPKLIIPLAYDSGGVTTSTVTVPLVTALGLGLAEAVPGRSILLDGFGLVASACLFPIIAVLAYGQLSVFRQNVATASADKQRHEQDENHAL